MTEQQKQDLREKYPTAMPVDVAAKIIGTSNRRMRVAIQKGQLKNIVIDLSDGENNYHYKILTERLIAYLEAEDMKQYLQGTETERVFTKITEDIVGNVLHKAFKGLGA